MRFDKIGFAFLLTVLLRDCAAAPAPAARMSFAEGMSVPGTFYTECRTYFVPAPPVCYQPPPLVCWQPVPPCPRPAPPYVPPTVRPPQVGFGIRIHVPRRGWSMRPGWPSRRTFH